MQLPFEGLPAVPHSCPVLWALPLSWPFLLVWFLKAFFNCWFFVCLVYFYWSLWASHLEFVSNMIQIFILEGRVVFLVYKIQPSILMSILALHWVLLRLSLAFMLKKCHLFTFNGAWLTFPDPKILRCFLFLFLPLMNIDFPRISASRVEEFNKVFLVIWFYCSETVHWEFHLLIRDWTF